MRSKLTHNEKQWLDKLQAVLEECPSDRLGFYTIGDPDITVFDKRKDSEIERIMNEGLSRTDFCVACDESGAELHRIKFPSAVYSTAG